MRKHTIFAYVSAPHVEGNDLLTLQAISYCKDLYDMGFIPICPALMFSQFLNDGVPQERESKQEMSLNLLRRCRVLVVCGNEVTDEMEREILLAKRLNIVSTTFGGIERLSIYSRLG